MTISFIFLLVSFLDGQRSWNGFVVFYFLSLVFAFLGLGIAKGAVQKALGMALCGILGAGAVIIALSNIGAGK